jgi:demethylmenaquinone methyltransferase/2-methoxy-6-polyprenyl-1,4-benzoquinol methylase
VEPVKSLPETYTEDPGFDSEAAKKRKKYMVDLFVRQAKNYDFHDDIYGFYAHRLWVRSLLKVVKDFMRSKKQADMLDLACGTGFVTYNIASRYENIDIDGLDLSPHMLEVAKERKEQGFKNRNIKFWVGDSEVPFGENKYDIITVSFAWRNFANKNLATANVIKALKPGGVFIIQDLTKPEHQPMQALYLFYMKNLLPVMTRILRTEKSADQWLLKSVKMMPKNAEIKKILEKAGFTNVYSKSMSLGIACLVVGYKPENE